MLTKNYLLFSLFALLIFAQSCHTNVFQNVDDQIQDSWILMPVSPNNTVEWSFSDGLLSATYNAVPVTFIGSDGTERTGIPYSIEKKVSNHYVYITPLKVKSGPQVIPMSINRYLVITSSDEELFLESVGEDGHKGEYQFHFFNK